MAVVHELAGGKHGGHEFRAVDHGVQAALQQTDQVFTGIALDALGFGIDAAELLFGQVAVMAFQLLLGAQLDAEIAELGLAALAVLAGTVIAAVDRAFRTAPDGLAHAAVEFILGRGAFGHRLISFHIGPNGAMKGVVLSRVAGDRSSLAGATNTNGRANPEAAQGCSMGKCCRCQCRHATMQS